MLGKLQIGSRESMKGYLTQKVAFDNTEAGFVRFCEIHKKVQVRGGCKDHGSGVLCFVKQGCSYSYSDENHSLC